ncbi:MAG: M20/M25/M40 family metallo-hydrolase [Chloroflexota bacterium]
MPNRIEQIAAKRRVQAALNHFHQISEQSVETILSIQQIAAPTFAEAERASYVEAQFAVLGLTDVEQDKLHNVYGRFPGRRSGAKTSLPPVIISAHTDTVFPIETDLATRRQGNIIYGPGIGDNSTGVAGLLLLIDTLNQHNLQPAADLWFVANVGEEGMGDLCGMRAVGKRFGPEATYLVVEGGLYGQIAHQAIGVRRFRIDVETGGGHSWANFGRPSAIHALGHIISQFDGISVPRNPKTTYNVGVISGGTSINTIAQNASCLLDLRSEDNAALQTLVGEAKAIVEQVRQRKWEGSRVKIKMTQVGNRPSGALPRQAPLVTWAEAALHAVGCPKVTYIIGSTDANIPLSMGANAVCIGLTKSGNAHRFDEYVDISKLPQGLGQLLLLILATAGF